MNRRTQMHRLQELVRLLRLGTGKRETARLLSMSPNTERRYRDAFDEAGLLAGDPNDLPSLDTLRETLGPVKTPPQQLSSLEDWRLTIEAKWRGGAGPQAIHDHLRSTRDDFSGSLSAVKRMCRQLAQARGVLATDVAIPVETQVGEVAQVDFGYVGMLMDPVTRRMRKAYVFVMVLGFSRHMFAKIVFDQKVTTWLQVHVDAFAAFGSVPRVVVPDNLKSAVIRASFGLSESVLNQSYRELARHFGFKIDPTPPYAPQKKGKVESGVKYVKGNFMTTLAEGTDVVEANAQLAHWVEHVAGSRIHGSTGKRPLAVFDNVERGAMLRLPVGEYDAVVWANPTLGRDCRFVFDGGHYSAPWRLVGQKMHVRATSTELLVFCEDQRVATHPRVAPGESSILDAHLPPGRRDFRHRAPAYWFERAGVIAPEVERWAREVMASDDVLHKIHVLQRSVPYLEELERARARDVCMRASFFGAYKFDAIKRIVTRGLEREPLPIEVVILDAEILTDPRFARDIKELLQLPMEETHEPN